MIEDTKLASSKARRKTRNKETQERKLAHRRPLFTHPQGCPDNLPSSWSCHSKALPFPASKLVRQIYGFSPQQWVPSAFRASKTSFPPRQRKAFIPSEASSDEGTWETPYVHRPAQEVRTWGVTTLQTTLQRRREALQGIQTERHTHRDTQNCFSVI